MTDVDRQEIRDFMATEVMGWTDFGDFYGRQYYPESPEVIITKENTSFGPGWAPDLDSNQLDWLVDKMVEDGWNFRMFLAYNGVVTVRFWRIMSNKQGKSDNPDRRLAVLLAIKAAKET